MKNLKLKPLRQGFLLEIPRDWASYDDFTDPHWKVKHYARELLRKIFDKNYQLSSECLMYCGVVGFDVNLLESKDLKKTAFELLERWKSCEFFFEDEPHLFELNLYANYCRFAKSMELHDLVCLSFFKNVVFFGEEEK